MKNTNVKEIYLAGGCFWGLEAYMDKIEGILNTSVGYSNGITKNPTYEEVCEKKTGHAETVYLAYDDQKISLDEILQYYFRVIDPTSLNRQGGDVGSQYRTGIYYVDKSDIPFIQKRMDIEQSKNLNKIVVEVKSLDSYYIAEEYHQKYLKKNPKGYCHIDLSDANIPLEVENEK